jgi:hypothetical protein
MLNNQIPEIKPAPFLAEDFYRDVCHGNLQRVTSRELLGGFAADRCFDDVVAGRMLSAAQGRLSPELMDPLV